MQRNDEVNERLGTMTVNELLSLATSHKLDDQQLADRLARRIALHVRSLRSVASTEEINNLRKLVKVTNHDLDSMGARK